MASGFSCGTTIDLGGKGERHVVVDEDRDAQVVVEQLTELGVFPSEKRGNLHVPRCRVDDARHANPGPDYADRHGTRSRLHDVVGEKPGDAVGTRGSGGNFEHPGLDQLTGETHQTDSEAFRRGGITAEKQNVVGESHQPPGPAELRGRRAFFADQSVLDEI